MRIVGFIAEKNRKTANFLFHVISRGDIAFPLSPRLPKSVIEKLPIDCMEEVKEVPFSFMPRSGPAIMLLSSGTTGHGKICTSSIANHIYSAKASNQILPLTSSDAWLCDLPLFHIAGIAILFRCYMAGAHVVFPGEPTNDITHISYVPTQLFRETRTFPKLKAMLVGGAALPNALKTERYPIIETYGATEMCSQIATDFRGKGLEILPHVEMKTDGGELLVRGKSLCDGLPLDRGWYRTGDLGSIEDGIVTIHGRKDRMFISGGENIYPEEIERELLAIPGVEKAHVHPLKCPEFGHRTIAEVSSTLPISEIEKILEEKLDRVKLPSKILEMGP